MRYTPSGALRVAWSWLMLALPWTRRAEMNRAIDLVALANDISREQAFALMYSHARDDRERALLAPYRPAAVIGGQQ